ESIESNSIILTLGDNAKAGNIIITIPRDLLDSKSGGEQNNESDDVFFVTVDGKEVSFTETKTTQDRTLTIEFKENTKTIKIIGTHLI
ncbi:MAG: PEFG-CTERM sorting domain-containing protein, partial [Nitrosarchaeum sp.]